MMVGLYKGKPLRWAKTLFFMVTMVASLLFVGAPPLFVAILDVLLPSALLSAASDSLSAAPTQLKNFTFEASLADVPIISVARSLLIMCAYLVCNGRGPYLGVTTACSFLSMGYVSAKAVSVCWRRRMTAGESDGVVADALFLSSLALAAAHIVVAYKTSCRERRKLIVYRIDIEAVSTYHSDFPNYHKIGLTK